MKTKSYYFFLEFQFHFSTTNNFTYEYGEIIIEKICAQKVNKKRKLRNFFKTFVDLFRFYDRIKG